MLLSTKYISFQAEQSSEISGANILCLGNFDGVHYAHRTLLRTAKKLQSEKLTNAKCGVFCFEKPSTDYLSSQPQRHLTTLDQKLKYFADEGMDFAIIVDFPEVKDLSPEAFVNEVLIGQFACVATVCGYNYHFGKKGAGTHQLLETLLPVGCAVTVPPVYQNGDTVSSTRIRRLLDDGHIQQANDLLTVPFSLTAPVEHGKGLGRQLCAPTFNQHPPLEMLIPPHGVYLTRCNIDGKYFYGLTNIGTRPTVDTNDTLNLETHLLDYEGDLYQRNLTVEFLDYIRPEIRFESTKELQAQIQQDIKSAKERL